jgi:two-component system LytT family sensor kinase
MAGRATIPKYHSKDFIVLVASMLPMAVLLNYFLYGGRYFQGAGIFAWSTLVSFSILGFAFLTYGFVAISLRNRFPEDGQLLKRMGICISIFFLMSAVYISLILLVYDNFHFFGYEYSENDFTKSYLAFIVINVFLTFLNEGVYRFEKYRSTMKETEQLKKEYMHSQLLGLKSQMNPHFLFNSLNTLSCLINEDQDKAEDFLDHMSKVYRYLLRNNEEQLVTVDTELNFIRSYYYLLKARHAEGLELTINVPEAYRNHMIPPLTLQMIIENSLNQNSLSRTRPLQISVASEDEWLQIKNNLQPRMNNNNLEECCEVMENIGNKFRLLCQQEIIIEEKDLERTIQLPLIPNTETVLA